MPLNRNHAIYKFRLTKKEFADAEGKNLIQCIAGRYRLKGRVTNDLSSLRYVSYEQALQLKIRTNGLSRDEVIRYVSVVLFMLLWFHLTVHSRSNEYHTAKMLEYQNSVANNINQRTVARPKYSPNPNPMAWPEEERFQVVISMPWISVRSGDAIVEWGVSCNGCKKRKPTRVEKRSEVGRDIRYDQVKLYSKAGFIDHFLECAHARDHYEEAYKLLPRDGGKYPVTPAQGCCVAGEGTNQAPSTGHSFWIPCRNFHFLHKVPIDKL